MNVIIIIKKSTIILKLINLVFEMRLNIITKSNMNNTMIPYNKLVVKKFGGSSVSNVDKIKKIADLIQRISDESIIIVISAMAGVTDQLLEYIRSISDLSSHEMLREYDIVLASGEQITVGLLTMALLQLNLKAKSYLGWQVPIITTNQYSKSYIEYVDKNNLINDINNGIIPIIAGFQGVYNNNITTLGRGGSDTTAVAIAVALNADLCEIYTDVKGIFTADPNIVPDAQVISEISYEEVLEFVDAGAKILHPTAVEIAYKNNLQILVLSTFDNAHQATMIKHKSLHKPNITGITSKKLILMQFYKPEQHKNVIDSALALNIVFEHIIMLGDMMTLFITEEDFVKFNSYTPDYIDDNIIQISIIGIGINDVRLLQKIHILLKEVKIIHCSVSNMKISIIIKKDNYTTIIQTLHSSLNLNDYA